MTQRMYSWYTLSNVQQKLAATFKLLTAGEEQVFQQTVNTKLIHLISRTYDVIICADFSERVYVFSWPHSRLIWSVNDVEGAYSKY